MYDDSLDASLWGLFAFGLYAADDPRIIATMAAMIERLWINSEVGVMARYEGDRYHREHNTYPGRQPYIICTLWYADYLVERARSEEDMQQAVALLAWVADHDLPSGVLAEQVHPESGRPLSVSPLTWSHATYINSARKIMRHYGRLKKCQQCGHCPGDTVVGGNNWLTKLFREACDSIHGICTVK